MMFVGNLTYIITLPDPPLIHSTLDDLAQSLARGSELHLGRSRENQQIFSLRPSQVPIPEENRDCDEIQDVEIHARPWLSFASLSMHILATFTGDGENGTHVKPIPPPNVHHQTNFTNYIQRYSSSLSRGFKDEDWGIPLASGLVTVATYCLCRTSLLLATTVTKNWDE